VSGRPISECERDDAVGTHFGVVDEGVPQVWGELDAGGVEGGELFLVDGCVVDGGDAETVECFT